MEPVQFLPIEPSDLDDLTDLFMRCFNAPPWRDGWSSEAARERLEAMVSGVHFRGVLARSGGRVVGMALGQKERWVEAHHFCLHEMCVEPTLQRQGIGGCLLDHLRQNLAEEGVTKIYLLTAPDDAAAAFYGRHGFHTSRGRIVMVSDLVGGARY